QRERVGSPLTIRPTRDPARDRFPVRPILSSESNFKSPFLVPNQEVRGDPQQEDDQDGAGGADDQGDAEDREEVRARDGIPGPGVRSGADESARRQPRVRSAQGSRKEGEAPRESTEPDAEKDDSREADKRRERW